MRSVTAGHDHLEGDQSAETNLASAIDDAHPAVVDHLKQLITLRDGTGTEIHR